MDDEKDGADGPGSTHRPATEPIRHEWTEAEDVSTALVRAVAATNGRPPDDLPPLNRYVDPDALDALVTTATARSRSARVSFVYAGVEVRIDSDDCIAVWPATDGET